MLRKLQSLVSDYFRVSYHEGRGILVLIAFVVIALLTGVLYKRFVPVRPVDTSVTDQKKLDSLLRLMQDEEANKPQYGKNDTRDRTDAERFNEPKRRTGERFAFNPNTVSVADWQRLGLPQWLAERIDKYRSKGGQFRQKADLLKIYNFPPALYSELEPYITLPASAPENGRRPFADRPAAYSYTSGNRYPERPHVERPVLQPFDINTADSSQLVALNGIGPTSAGRILKFRNALGGFVSTNQFADIYGLDSVGRVELMRLGQIRSAPRRIPINTASAADLDRHPFLSRRQAEVIVRYREQHGAFTSAESLKPIRILDAQTIEKIAPYLEF
ncbi:competence ComEA-like helix-hairpin-helix protein [Spirosoma oryzae]|uniref:Competence ComEA-like helix-hairpin-helix protein n=1 Tax=Spirosoma oryzae TaxID=1469603 RepID=A0A2T0SVX5_9BACT|nr:helix-hairpin-helix domain-containing protein [Spirosoma oryzae]PRY37577.1 competence ComEA-like helix-hairpin-helix protein [Spirosoma oryzae]